MRILLIRTSALGDVVHCLPVLTALRRHLPRARIGWLVEEAMAPLLEGHPDLDELIVVRLRSWRRRPFSPGTLGQIRAFFTALHDFAPEVVLDLMGNHKAGILAALSLADLRIGPAAAARREPSSALWISHPVPVNGGHAVDRVLSLLPALGLPPEPPDFGPEKLFPTVPPTSQRLLEVHPEPYVLIHPGAGWGNKRYPASWWGEVATRLREAAGLAVRVTASPGEEELAREVHRASGGAAEILPAPDLPTLAAFLRPARLVVGGDTGPIHLAHALGTSVLCLMGPTDPQVHGPYGAPERALWRALPCSFCHKRMAETKACLLEIPPAQVAERALAMLG